MMPYSLVTQFEFRPQSNADGRRAAFTLVEMVLALTLGSLIMLLATNLVHKAFEISKAARHRSELTQSMDRVFELFRQDCHQALKSQRKSDGSGLELQTKSQRVQYEFKAASLEEDAVLVRSILQPSLNRMTHRIVLTKDASRQRQIRFSVQDGCAQLEVIAQSDLAAIVERHCLAQLGRYPNVLELSPERDTHGEVSRNEMSSEADSSATVSETQAEIEGDSR